MATHLLIGRQRGLLRPGIVLVIAVGLLWLLAIRPIFAAGGGFGGGSSAMSSMRGSTGAFGAPMSGRSSMAVRSSPAITGAGGMSGSALGAGGMTGSTPSTTSNLLGATGLAVGPASGGGTTTAARLASGPAGSGPDTLGLLATGQNGLAAQAAPSAAGPATGLTNLGSGPTSPTGTTGIFGSTGFGAVPAGGGGMSTSATGTGGASTSGPTASGATPRAQRLGSSGLSAQSAPPVSGPSGSQVAVAVPSGAALETGTTGVLGASGFDVAQGGGAGMSGPSTGTATAGTTTAPTTGASSIAAAPTNTVPSSNQPAGGANPPSTVPNTIASSQAASGGGGGGTAGGGTAGTSGGGSAGGGGGNTRGGGGTGATAGTGGGVISSLGNAAAGSSGVSIASVAPGTLAAEAGFQSGDEILKVDNQAVQSPQDLERLLLEAGRSGRAATVQLRRNGAEQSLELPGQQLRTLIATLETGVPDGAPGGAAMGILLDRMAFPRLVVREVKAGSPASLAGLQPGDEIVSVMGQPVESPQQLRRAVTLAGVGGNLRITYRRGDRQFQADTPLSSYAALFGKPTGPEPASQRMQGPALGIRVARDSSGRVVVTAVQTDSPAAMAGIQAGDQIVSAQGAPVTTPAALASLVEQAGIGNQLDLLYRRNGTDFRAAPRVLSYSELFGPGRTLHGEQPSIGIRLRETPTGGSLVSAIAPNGPAAKAGLQPGDLIQIVNGQAVHSPLDVVAAIQRAGIGGSVQIRYVRGDQTREASAPVQEFAVAYGMQQGTERQVAKPPTEPSGTPAPPANPANK